VSRAAPGWRSWPVAAVARALGGIVLVLFEDIVKLFVPGRTDPGT